MNRLLTLLLVACVLSTASCGDIFVRGAINPGSQVASGVVSIIQFSAVSGDGVSITIITLTSNGIGTTFNFCGDQRTRFPLNRQVNVNFMPGNSCDSVVAVVLG
jgi:hypothetical protein